MSELPTTRLVLVRHGEAECNVAKRFGGPLGCSGLSERGREQVAKLRDRVARTGELDDATLLYASTLPRAIETAEILNEALELDLATDERVCELHPGDADNMTFADYTTTYYREGSAKWRDDPSIPTAPRGESWTGFMARVTEALHDLTERHAGETIVVACHGGVVDTSMLQLLGMDSGYVPSRFITENSSLTEWTRRGERWRLVRYNDAAHLHS
ncbi:MAG TPA: histidine phosphatase family protein [Acidimicrobiales bacterium]|nr:histidine phosphatase family protein [Acidimicrobiales bacterium]